MKANFIKFLVSKTFFKNLGLALLITLLLIVAIQVGLRIYTEHGKEITVPDFSGMPLKQVDQLCFQNNLLWLVQDSVYIKDSAGGIIMDQYPLPGSRVKRNRKIFLTTNAWFPESVKMPKAYDMPFRQAERVLQSAGLVIDSIDYQPYFAYKYVREQRFNGEIIPAGTPIPKGSGITLVVGQGLSNERSPVPNLLSLTKDSAQATALKNYFNLGAIVYD
ncbi:MAG: PASTA domain-containing protein, partial [Bacteroidales bacterium]|nr:PASTA domain-containing protein [Bacteroidales bacterium]